MLRSICAAVASMPLPEKISKFGDNVDKTLEATQVAGSKILKRLLKIMAGAAIALGLTYKGVQSFQEKSKEVLDGGGGVQKLEENTFRIKGRTPADSPKEVQ